MPAKHIVIDLALIANVIGALLAQPVDAQQTDVDGDLLVTGKVGIALTTPTQSLTIQDGQILLQHSTANPFESGRVRLTEKPGTSFRGAYMHYDGSANVLNLGVHDADDLTTSADVNAISILRSNGNVGIGTTSPLARLHIQSTDLSGTAHAIADNLLIEGNDPGLTIFSPVTESGSMVFGSSDSNVQGSIQYRHSGDTSPNEMTFQVQTVQQLGLGPVENVFNELGINRHFRVETMAGPNGLFVQGETGQVAIGTNVPVNSTRLTVVADSFGADSGILLRDNNSGNRLLTLRHIADNAGALSLYFTGLEQVRLRADNSASYINTTGHFGIGTSSTAAKLHVHADNGLPLTLNSTTILARFRDDFVDSGNQSFFDIKQRAHATRDNTWHNSALRLEASIDGSAAAQSWIEFMHFSISSSNAITFGEGSGGTGEWMRIKDGLVGIGTASPTTDLHVEGILGAIVDDTSQTGAAVTIDAFNPNVGAITGERNLGLVSNSAYDVLIYTGATERVRFDNGGNVGIGTATPDYKLDVAGDVGMDDSLWHNGDADTRLRFTNDQIVQFAGGVNFAQGVEDDTQDNYTINTNALDVDFVVKTDNDPSAIFADGGADRIGIGNSNPAYKLDIDGVLRLRDVTANDIPEILGVPTAYNGGGGLLYSYQYLGKSRLYAADENTATRLTSHADPREEAPAAQTSFEDPSVVLPHSFQHFNSLIGKGAIVDISKMVAYIESRMQAELGIEGGRLVHTYDLPASHSLTLADWEEGVVDGQVRRVEAYLETMPWIHYDGGGRIPPEAIVEEPEIEQFRQTITLTEKVMDFDLARIVDVTRNETILVDAPTGQTVRRLSDDWRFENGELYRRPTINDIDVPSIIDDGPTLPEWVLDRLPPAEVAAAMSSEERGTRVLERVVARLAPKDPNQAVVQAASPPEAPDALAGGGQ